MNDLMQLREFGLDLERDLTELSPALRNRIVSSFEPHSSRAPGWPRQPRHTAQLRRRLRISVAVLASVTAVVVGLTALGFWGNTPAADAQAVRILNHAASAALQRPAPHIRPSDFVFTRVVEMAATIGGPNHHPLVSHTSVLREQWLSASGRRKGLLHERPFSIPLGHPTGRWRSIVLQACVHGHLVPPGSGWHTQGGTGYGRCRPVPADLRHLPTTEPAMRRYLYHHLAGQNPPDQQAFITAGDLIRYNYIRPAALAAIFRAVAHIPGVTVVHGAVSANGRRGIAVQRIYRGVSDQLIFDPATYTVIGEREVVVGPGTGVKVGTIMDLTTIITTRIVHSAGKTH
jgi:hypothetical protein